MTFGWTQRVYMEDTDAGGIMYHANHLKFMERARTEWLRNRGSGRLDLPVTIVVNQLKIDYRIPARLDDLLTGTVQVIQVRPASFTLLQQLWRGNDLIAIAEISLACLDQQLRPVCLPAALVKTLGNP